MALIRFDTVSFQYGVDLIFEDITFQINPGDHTGIIGPNGCGKTTLLKMMSNTLHHDKGSISTPNTVTIGLLEQHIHIQSDLTLFEEMQSAFSFIDQLKKQISEMEHTMSQQKEENEKLAAAYGELLHQLEEQDGYNTDVKIGKVLSGLGFSRDQFDSEFNILSGGQKTRANLAKLLLLSPDLLLLDEPTNHLDIHSIEWLEEFLRTYKKAFVIVSHDRYFLDKTVTKTIEIDQCRIKEYKGNYSFFIKQKAEMIAQQQKMYDLQQKEIENKEEFIRRNMAGQKTKQAQSRLKELEKTERISAPPAKARKISLKFEPSKRTGSTVLSVNEVSKQFDGFTLFENVSFELLRGQKIGIAGPNGCGKTTLLKIITGELEASSGTAHIGLNTQVGYFSQHLDQQDPENSVLDEIWQINPAATIGEMRKYLAKFLFFEEDVFKKVKTLSGGEKSRVELAKLILSDINFLILDEPTNHLDIFARDALEEALDSYQGAILTVSHDRYFLDKIARKIIYIEEGKHTEYDGNYSYFEEKYQQNKASAGPDEKKKASKEDYKMQKKMQREKEKKNKKRNPHVIEDEIKQVEERIEVLEAELAKPEVYNDYKKTAEIDGEYKKLQEKQENLYAEWEDAVEG